MAFKNPNYTPEELKKNSVRVRKSYYTFSKEYPIGDLGKRSKKDRQKRAKAIRSKVLIGTLCFVLIALLSYFAADLGLKFSYKDSLSTEQTTAAEIPDGQEVSVFASNGVKALYMPTEKLNDKKYIKKFIRSIKSKDADSVVIDFKTQNGQTAHLSSATYAVLGKCAIFDNETVREAIAMFQEKGINVIAGIYCFEDPRAAALNSDISVKYMNSDVVWLDKPADEGGRPWLNPYSKEAQDYIREIISEVNAMGVKGFLLRSVSFPGGENSDTAGYPGEKKKSERNAVLLSFIESVRKLLPDDCFVLVAQTANDVLNGNDKLYFGSLARSAADGVCADVAVRPEGYVPDKKTGYSSMISLFSNMGNSISENSRLVVMIDMEEYSRKYIRTIVKSGYSSYILY